MEEVCIVKETSMLVKWSSSIQGR